MKNKHLYLSAILLAAALTGCNQSATQQPSAATQEPSGEKAEEGSNDTVQLKEGHGLAFHPKVKKTIGLVTAEVVEQKIAPKFTASLHVISGSRNGLQKVAYQPGKKSGTEASGWLPAEKATLLQPGQEVELQTEVLGSVSSDTGRVKRVEKSPYATLGDYEVTVETDADFDTGTRMTAIFHTPETEAVPTVPRSALLRTAEGWFVYAVNEKFFLRTAVKVGAMNDEFAEVTDGLYAGDQIVTSPVNTLWMAELQILRGGKACTCGH